jgi:LysM repeat protein
MKKLFFLILFLPLLAFAQKGKTLTHTVAAKESLSSIGRMYGINGRELAKFNNIDYEKGLSLGQVLKIPATAKLSPPIQEPEPVKVAVKAPASPVPAEVNAAGSPIYHVVAKKETLYHISTLYNKVPIADLKKWNHLTGDGVPEGASLIVGYSKSAAKVETASSTPPPVIKKDVPPVVEKVTVKPASTEVAKVEAKPVSTNTGRKMEEGYFKNSYSKSASRSEEKGTAGIFKSTSGWDDGKYYCLHNAAVAGSIIKITNSSTQKSIYAKVLDVMPDIKQNKGLVLLVSDAAAGELGAGTTNFECAVTY